MALTHQAHQAIRTHFQNRPLDYAVDATCGNGHDTVFLASLARKQVWGFDVQSGAIEATRTKLTAANIQHVNLIHAGHETMQQHIDQPIDCIMFNLGYLPRSDKTITTEADSSLLALNQSTKMLNPGGLISLLCYPGHDAGAVETHAVQSWLSTLDLQQWCCQQLTAREPKPTSPILYLLYKNDV
ncbi:rRNA methyltransferase [Arenicella chitinivorans]|uniref:rRNA methyltransferase n=1 Tax=Arenicella chitinivorans TaxID=1329800 RepID=A0A918RN66_9GAMM|nr:class I SAM-dependent methyltransferase [Arenicella chitinivorans]GHA03852.1 rRNA methyltransferase [Arenicella chitinivorans]